MAEQEETIRPTHLEIDLARLAENYRLIAQHVAPSRVMVILKANAYGHGMIRIAQLMEQLGSAYIGVAYLEEGILLREAGIRSPILVLGGIVGNQIPLFLRYQLTLTASSAEKLEQIEATAQMVGQKARIHLKIDTGMERIGTHYYSAEPLLEAASNSHWCEVEGIYSHFANSDSADLTHARLQLERFQQLLTFYERRNLPRPLVHVANSGAILQLPEAHFDMVRAGILLYGVYPSAELPYTLPVRPAMQWISRIVYFKVVQPYHPVSYGSTWQSDSLTRVVTVPLGYGDGYFRAMSGKAEVLIHGKKYPVIGRICMDQLMVNIGLDSAYNGDVVTLMGQDGEEIITPEQLAEWAGTIPYEILTNINTRVPRRYLNEENFAPN